MAVTPQYVFEGLKKRGLSDAQAYATLGNWKQESEFNPGAINPGEGAVGFDQWRLERRTALQNFAKASGRTESDPEAQMDFYIHELQQHPGGQQFLAAKDIPTANAALKTYIAYGSPYNQGGEGTRLQNALNYANQGFGGAQQQGPTQSGAPLVGSGALKTASAGTTTTPAGTPTPTAGATETPVADASNKRRGSLADMLGAFGAAQRAPQISANPYQLPAAPAAYPAGPMPMIAPSAADQNGRNMLAQLMQQYWIT